jgi:hypothetical protein
MHSFIHSRCYHHCNAQLRFTLRYATLRYATLRDLLQYNTIYYNILVVRTYCVATVMSSACGRWLREDGGRPGDQTVPMSVPQLRTSRTPATT